MLDIHTYTATATQFQKCSRLRRCTRMGNTWPTTSNKSQLALLYSCPEIFHVPSLPTSHATRLLLCPPISQTYPQSTFAVDFARILAPCCVVSMRLRCHPRCLGRRSPLSYGLLCPFLRASPSILPTSLLSRQQSLLTQVPTAFISLLFMHLLWLQIVHAFLHFPLLTHLPPQTGTSLFPFSLYLSRPQLPSVLSINISTLTALMRS